MALAITSITPNYGPAPGGDTVVIVGTDFEELRGTGTVTFGGIPAKSYVAWGDLSITVITPAHSAGDVDVVVTNDADDSVTEKNGFTYIASPAIYQSHTGIGIGVF